MEKFDETKLKLFGGKDEEKIERIMDVTTGGVAVFPLIPKSVTLPDDSDRSIEAAIEIAQNLEEAIASIQYYEKELASARKELQEIVDSLGNGIGLLLDGDKWESNGHKVSYRTSESLKIVDETLIPDQFMKIPAPTPDKAAIKKAIKTGTDVPGAILEKKQNIQIS